MTRLFARRREGRGAQRLLRTLTGVLLTGLLSAGLTVVGAPARAATISFTDVTTSNIFYTQIMWLANQGISTGWVQPDGTRIYQPLLSVNRDAMAAFMYRLAGSPTYTPPASSPFTDITPATQFYKEITWLSQQGISTGYDNGNGTRSYHPLSAVNRDAMAAFMYRYAGSPVFNAPATSPFTDVATNNPFYAQIAWLAAAGISTGWSQPDGTKIFQPVSPVARDAMAAFMYRFYNSSRPSLTVTSTSLPPAETMTAYQASLTATGGTSPYRWAVSSGTLPAGLTLDSASGTISGTPTTAGSSYATFQVTDSSNTSAYYGISITVNPGALRNVASVVTDGDSTGAIKTDGTVWTWGSLAKQVAGISAAQSLSLGYSTDYALTSDGTVWQWTRWNPDGTSRDTFTASQVPGLTGVLKVSATSGNAYALRTDGTVWAWGDNTHGQLGNGTTNSSDVPVQVSGLSGVQQVYAVPGAGYALKTDGTVWAWGNNQSGQLGNGSTVDSNVPVMVSGLSGVKQVAADLAVYALKSDGTVWGWGSNGNGQLGNGTTADAHVPVQMTGLSAVQSIGTDGWTAYALKSDGTVWTCGLNGFGELGNGTTTDSSLPVQATGLSGVNRLVVGYGNAYALKTDGTVWSWGMNTNGGLGNGTTADAHVPTKADGFTGALSLTAASLEAFAVMPDSTVWASGAHVNMGVDSSVPVPVKASQ